MEPFRYHVYICRQNKPEGAPACLSKGAKETIEELKSELATSGLSEDVRITGCDCLGICNRGPNMVVYPDGVWYSKVTADDVPEIVSRHFKRGKPVERLMLKDEASLKQEILDHDRNVAKLKDMMSKAGIMVEEGMQVMRGFQESRIMLSAVELDVFSAIGDGATAGQVADKIGAQTRSTEMLLNAVAAIEMLDKKGDTFYNSAFTAKYLREGSPDDSRSALGHIIHLWHSWSTLTDAVKKGTAVNLKPVKVRDEKRNRAFIAAMHSNASFRAPQIAGAIDLTGVNKLLDLGGGSGAYAMAFAPRKPEMEVIVFDLPNVVPLTKEYLEAERLDEQVKTVPGDMTEDDLGNGYDLVFVSAICHMFSPEENLDLFKRIDAALNPGGRVVIQDFILNESKTSPRMAAVFALNMLVNTKGGSSYSAKEYMDWLAETGFAESNEVPLPGPTNLVIGKKS